MALFFFFFIADTHTHPLSKAVTFACNPSTDADLSAEFSSPARQMSHMKSNQSGLLADNQHIDQRSATRFHLGGLADLNKLGSRAQIGLFASASWRARRGAELLPRNGVLAASADIWCLKT